MTNPWIEGYPTFRQNQHVSYLNLLVHAMQKSLFPIINSVANPLLTRSIATRYKQQPLGIDYQPLLQSFVRDPQTSNKHINVYQRDNINKILGVSNIIIITNGALEHVCCVFPREIYKDRRI